MIPERSFGTSKLKSSQIMGAPFSEGVAKKTSKEMRNLKINHVTVKMPQEPVDSVISNIYNIISKNLKTSCKALGMDEQTNKMSLSTNVRPPRFIPQVVTRVNVGCRRRCVFPELYPVSNRDFRHPSVLSTTVPAVWLGCSGQSMKWEGSWQKLQACRSRRARHDADKQDQPMMASCFHNGRRSQLLPNHHKPGKLPRSPYPPPSVPGWAASPSSS